MKIAILADIHANWPALSAIDVRHLPLYTGPDDERTVWRSGLAPYAGTVTRADVGTAERAEPRPGGFSYVLAPDGALFELTGGPDTTPSLSHVHLFHEQPQCAANWYVSHLGMALAPVRKFQRARLEVYEHELADYEIDAAAHKKAIEAGAKAMGK